MKHQRSIFLCVLAAMLLVLISAQGCYRRVVSAKGPAASTYDVYEPNLPDDPPPSRLGDKDQNGAEKSSEKSAPDSEKKWWWPF